METLCLKALEDRPARNKELSRMLSRINLQDPGHFPRRVYHVPSLGNLLGFVVEVEDGDADALYLEYPLLIDLEQDQPPRIGLRLLAFGVYWVKVYRRHIACELVVPEAVYPLYLRYLHGFLVSQMTAENHEGGTS